MKTEQRQFEPMDNWLERQNHIDAMHTWPPAVGLLGNFDGASFLEKPERFVTGSDTELGCIGQIPVDRNVL